MVKNCENSNVFIKYDPKPLNSSVRMDIVEYEAPPRI